MNSLIAELTNKHTQEINEFMNNHTKKLHEILKRQAQDKTALLNTTDSQPETTTPRRPRNNVIVKPVTTTPRGLQGYLTSSYADLVRVFGHPQYTDTSGSGKTDIEWEIQINYLEFNTVRNVTIYNWKDYDGGLEARSNPKYKWHIGGHCDLDAVQLKQYFNEAMKEAV